MAKMHETFNSNDKHEKLIDVNRYLYRKIETAHNDWNKIRQNLYNNCRFVQI